MGHIMRKAREIWSTAVTLGALLVVLGIAGSGNLATAAKSQPPPPPRFVDNGDGTITDTQTGLMWEQKTGTADAEIECTDPTTAAAACIDPTHVNNEYGWTSVPFGVDADGTLFTDFLPKMNCSVSTGACPAQGKYRDWRIPTIEELSTILQVCSGCPRIDPIFGPTGGHTIYWSSTGGSVNPSEFLSNAWGLNFAIGPGEPASGGKWFRAYARAVRGGS